MRIHSACIVLTLGLAAAMATSSMAGRPLAIDDADPADPGQLEVEAGVAYEKDSGFKHWHVPVGLAYGLVDRLEVGAGFGGQFERRTETIDASTEQAWIDEESVGDLVIGGKWQIIEACPLGARHAVAPSVKFPTADEDKDMGSGETDYDLTWIISRNFGDKTGAHINVGYSWIGGPGKDLFHYGLALDYQVADALQWVGEAFAEQELTSGSDTVAQFNTGLRWVPIDGLTADAAVGSNLTDDAADFTATIGLTWAFETRSSIVK